MSDEQSVSDWSFCTMACLLHTLVAYQRNIEAPTRQGIDEVGSQSDGADGSINQTI